MTTCFPVLSNINNQSFFTASRRALNCCERKKNKDFFFNLFFTENGIWQFKSYFTRKLRKTLLTCCLLKLPIAWYPLWKKWACGKVCCRAMTKLWQWCSNIAARLLQCVFTMQMKAVIRLPQTYCKIAANIWLYYGKRDFTKLNICMRRPSGMLLF